MGLRIRHAYKTYYKELSALLIMCLLWTTLEVQAQDFQKILDLKGDWKFSIGDNPAWSKPEFDDRKWQKIYVPKSWEQQGFHGYNGYAWYRITVSLQAETMHSSYYLKLGFIDDVDEVYINGEKIGSTGSFPPNYSTAYNANRIYLIPHKVMRDDGKLHIAVKVFDEGGEGGFIHGDVSIGIDRSAINTDFDLQGDWRFKTGRCSGIPQEKEYQNWNTITVPGAWEDQGYKGYDGLACYVKEFELEGQFEGSRMVIILGRIDDLDMVYLNGTLIGQSGRFSEETVRARPGIYNQIRAYYIPSNVLVDRGKNILVVKVLDLHGLGGIWDGTVGLIKQDNYIQYWRNKRKTIK